MFDTYIADPVTWQKLRELSHKIEADRDVVRRLRFRVNRTNVFYDYIHACFLPLVLESQKRGLPAQWCTDVMAERKADLRRELSRVLASARKNYGPGGRNATVGAHYINDEDEEDFTNL